jgi:predicted methyltransferase
MRAVGLTWLLIFGVGAVFAAPQTPARSRLFKPEDLGQLEGPDRDEWQQPDRVMDALLIADRSIVADLGAGGGWFTVRLARRVGPSGLVYAEDVQPQMIASIKRRIEREELQNVKAQLGTPLDPGLPEGKIHAVVAVDMYPYLSNPVVLLGNIKKALTPTGRLGIVDFRPGGGGPGPDDRVAPETVIQDAKRAGLRLLSQETFLRYQYLLVFTK